jgi:hypothetical protein
VPLDLRTRWAARKRIRTRVSVAAAGARARWPAAVLRPIAVALLAAALLGLGGAAFGQWIGWQTASPLPTDAEATAIARLALGGPAPEPDRRDEIYGMDADGRYGGGRVRFTVPADPAAAAYPWQVKDVRVRLATAGWSVDKTWAGDGPYESSRDARRAGAERAERVDGLQFVADKGDWRVTYTVGPGDEAHLDIVRAAPLWVPLGGLIGGLIGAVLGWLAGRRAVRRWRGLTGVPRRTAAVLAVAGAIGMLPAFVVTLVREAVGYAQLSRPQVPLWTGIAEPTLRPVAALAALALLAAFATVAVTRPAGPPSVDEREVNGALRPNG